MTERKDHKNYCKDKQITESGRSQKAEQKLTVKWKRKITKSTAKTNRKIKITKSRAKTNSYLKENDPKKRKAKTNWKKTDVKQSIGKHLNRRRKRLTLTEEEKCNEKRNI